MCWHKWSKWSEPERKQYETETRLRGVVIGEPYTVLEVEQTRHCFKCNKIEIRTIKW